MSTLNVAARYLALFLQASSYAGYVFIPISSVFLNIWLISNFRYIVFYSWISSTFPRPPAKRAVAIALINAFAQLGNIAGSYVWGLKDNGYRKSYGIVTAMFGCTIVGALVLRMMLSRLNKRLEELEREETQAYEAEKVREAQADEALRVQKGFRYLV
jgi:predicted MFS family arabinose efflux permease